MIKSRYDCEQCGASPAAKTIHRTSPKGEDFRGSCGDCLGGVSAQTPEGQIREALNGPRGVNK